MVDDKGVFTFEVLYELLRREKNKEELQPLDEKFFASVLVYLREKQLLFEESMKKTDIFSVADREKLSTQLYNIKKVLKELYERRERKVVNMAMNRSRIDTNIVDTTTLLSQERDLFEKLVGTLGFFRRGVLNNLLELRDPMITGAFESGAETGCVVPENSPGAFSENNSQEDLDEEAARKAAQQDEEDKKTKLVKFCVAVEQFVGPETELYGPFEPESKAYLPKDIANILIGDGRASELDEE